MTQMERQIRTAQHRLWLNRWLRHVSWCAAMAAAAFAGVVLIDRLFDLGLPVLVVGWVLGGVGVVSSVIWTITTREDAMLAAVRLDEAAGLRERLSSGHFCRDSHDPFAQAVSIDAERTATSVSARQHIRLTVPRPLAFTAGSIILAALMFLITPGLLKPSAVAEAEEQREEVQHAKAAVKRKLDAVRRAVDSTPVLADLKDDLEGLDKEAGGELQRPGDIRHEAVKKIDHLADAIKEKRKSPHYDGMQAMRKMMRGLKVPQPDSAPTRKLAKALRQGDFNTAKEEIKALREQLATLKSKEDQEMVAKLSKQLEDLAKQLEQLAKSEKLAKKLEDAGLKKEEVERLLQNLTKKDLDQLKKQLEERGMSQQQAQKLARQVQQQQQAGAAAGKLAQAVKQGAKAGAQGNVGDAMAGLTLAEDQLSQLEQLEQEMAQLDATLASLQASRNELDKPCSACNGTGMVGGRPCSRCAGGGQGGGMGGLGQGRGGLAPEEQTHVGFKIERGKVHTGKGAIIGQFLVDGEQVKGDIASDLAEIVSAAERDASDRINRDRVPRQYQKAVKEYFSSVDRLVGRQKGEQSSAVPGAASEDSTEQTPGDAGND